MDLFKCFKPKKLKQPSFLVVDAIFVVIALFGSFLLRFGMDIPTKYIEELLFLLPLAVVIKVLIFYIFGFYNQLWQYASLKEGLRLLRGITAASLLLLVVLFLIRRTDIPRGVFVIDWLLTLCLVGGSYFIIRARKDLFPLLNFTLKEKGQKKVIIVGAGEAGSTLVKQIQRNPEKGYRPVAIIDDDPSKTDLMVHGIKVVGVSRNIPSIIASYPADEIILAIPSASLQNRKRIAMECQKAGIACKTVPDFMELVDGRASILQIRDISPKELLGRKETEINLKDTMECYEGKTILITGAAGSIGSELCRQAIDLKPSRVIAADISENGLYHLEEEILLCLGGNDIKMAFEIRVADARDKDAVDRLFKLNNPDIVFHAAAYKHVPMMEKHQIEAMENNFLGTRIMIDAARRYNCERFVFVSTDKAVNPTSIMGLSKQFGEQSIKLAASEASSTKFMAVRFGNVLGSNGSVIPKFKRQINNGEPVTVTHPDITRYFMTIHEAVYLVIQATAMGKGGEIFVLDMGEPIRILDLARNIIRLSGFEPEKDIPIEITGLRPGEKLYEELFAEDEVVGKTNHPKINVVLNDFDKVQVAEAIGELELTIRDGDNLRLIEFLSERRFGGV